MVPVADVTELMRPQLEKTWDDGIEKGIEKGIAKGKLEGIKEGEKKGIKEGEKKGITQTAKRLKAAGADMELIIKATGLSEEEIRKL